MKRRRPVGANAETILAHTYRSPSVRLSSAVGEAGDGPVWLQIARTGTWRGYRSGKPLEFTAELFGKLIANFRDHPWYGKGPDGTGNQDVVQFDLDHGSEVPATEIEPASWVAQAWVQELETRLAADGKTTELWALTRLLEPARTWVKEERIKSTSVAVWMNATDPETGKDIGPKLTSVAFTNHPFIEGMAPIAARIAASMAGNVGGERVAAGSYGSLGYYSRACDAEEALGQLRGLFGLPQTSSIGDVQGEIGKLRAWVEGGTIPMGVNADGLIGAMREILGLPALSTTADVFAELAKLVPALIDQESTEAGNLPADSASANVAPSAAAPVAYHTGVSMDLKVLLSQRLGIKTNSDEAIADAVAGLLEHGTVLASLYKSLGVKDRDEATIRLTELFAARAELEGPAGKPEEGLRAKFSTLQRRVAEIDNATAAADVAEVIAARSLPEDMADALMALRLTSPAKFAEKYPKAARSTANGVIALSGSYLSRTLFANGDGAQIGTQRTGAVALTAGRGGDTAHVPINGAGELATIDSYDGRNRVEKCMSFLRANNPAAKGWDLARLHEEACKLNRQFGRPAA